MLHQVAVDCAHLFSCRRCEVAFPDSGARSVLDLLHQTSSNTIKRHQTSNDQALSYSSFMFKFCTRLRLLPWRHFFTWVFTRMLLTRLAWTPVRMSQTLGHNSKHSHSLRSFSVFFCPKCYPEPKDLKNSISTPSETFKQFKTFTKTTSKQYQPWLTFEGSSFSTRI